jgi:hypothetical protein
MFSSSKKSHLSHHVQPRIHHEFTTKTPPKNTRFSRTPIKKRPRNQQNWPGGRFRIFSKNSVILITADSNIPAHNTDMDSSQAEVVEDSAAASAAVAVVAAPPPQADSIPPEIPS